MKPKHNLQPVGMTDYDVPIFRVGRTNCVGEDAAKGARDFYDAIHYAARHNGCNRAAAEQAAEAALDAVYSGEFGSRRKAA